ncbi:MAG: glycerophosphodiester phosphodiesterase, partial [Gammaproteobacteria bacterium HGW-Gammaproteobacteria-7]
MLAGASFPADLSAKDLQPGAAARGNSENSPFTVQLGPRPFYLVDEMSEGVLKDALAQCRGPFVKTTFSIGHRGAPLQFPEHTEESYRAAARMGAGIVECDVTYTADGELVCRHAQCDLHTTTNILATPLADTCVQPFTPAEFDDDGKRTKAASAKCCTGALTLNQFKSLCGKMDASNPGALTAAQFLGGTADWRTDLYTTCGTVLSHKESIALFRELGVGMTPELKEADPDGGFPFASQQEYAAKMIGEYIEAGVSPKKVWPQSFNPDDVRQWIREFPEFGRQAVYLDARDPAILADAIDRASDPG